jgi:hypothetical protein
VRCGMYGRGQESVQGLGGKVRRRDHLKDQGIDGRMSSEWLGECIVDPFDSGWGPVAGSCEFSDEAAGSGAMELVHLLVLDQ